MANWRITTGYVATDSNGVLSNVTIASVNDQTKPSNAGYVSIAGNNTTGNGSRDRPWATIAYGLSQIATNSILVIGTGVYREGGLSVASKILHIIADGNVWLDGTGLSAFFTAITSSAKIGMNGFFIANYVTVSPNLTGTSENFGITNCRVANCTNIYCKEVYGAGNIYYNMALVQHYFVSNPPAAYSKQFVQNTYVNCKNVIFANAYAVWTNRYAIFKNCNIQYLASTTTDYNVYHNCNFRFNASAGTQPSLLPEDSSNAYIPTGWMGTRPTTVAAIQAGQAAAGFAGVGFANSLMGDPLLNNVTFLDFTLGASSPARNLAYEGSFVGAKSVGTILKFRATEASGNWNNTAATNITVADDSATLSTDALGVIESNVIDLGKEKTLRAISLQALLGDRNGEWVDATRNVDANTTPNGSNLLIDNSQYVVEGGTITYNGTLYNIGNKFTVVAGILDYTPTGSGLVRKILEVPNRLCYEMRISNVSSGDCAAATYRLYEFEMQPTVNRTGDVSSGAISLGNGSITFDRTPAKVFVLSARWIQIRLTAQNNNLT